MARCSSGSIWIIWWLITIFNWPFAESHCSIFLALVFWPLFYCCFAAHISHTYWLMIYYLNVANAIEHLVVILSNYGRPIAGQIQPKKKTVPQLWQEFGLLNCCLALLSRWNCPWTILSLIVLIEWNLITLDALVHSDSLVYMLLGIRNNFVVAQADVFIAGHRAIKASVNRSNHILLSLSLSLSSSL